MRTYKDFIIRFIRDTDKQNKDDKLRITPVYDKTPETFEIEFRYSENCSHTNKPIIHKFYLQKNDIYIYVQSILKLINLDSEPFEAIQLDIPAYPTCLLKSVNFNEILSNLNTSLNLLMSNEDSWPYEDNPDSDETAITQMNTHKYFDSDGDTIPYEYNDDKDSYVCI